MTSPEHFIRAALTSARIERVVARLAELSDDRLEGIEANLFELGELRARCNTCAYLYHPYLERCPSCARRAQRPVLDREP
jgi:uncharacterized OB-fold protein